MSVIGLGIDAGASSSRWCLLHEDRGELAKGVTGPITGHIFTDEGKRENLGRLAELLEAALAVARPDAVVGGVTGLHGGTPAAERFHAEVAGALHLEPSRIQLDNDIAIAYACAFAPGEGVLLYAGTGSVSYHLRADGAVFRAGGYGYLIDDAGAGYWLGHKALKHVFRALDERGQPATTPLARALYEALGSDDWDGIISTVYGGGRSRVAALAPSVAHAAEQGDSAALYILEQAGKELARLANVILGRLDKPLPVAFSGGITQLSPVLTTSLETALLPGTPLHIVTRKPVEAAARLALHLARQEV